MGADNSPFIPQTPAELAALKAEIFDQESQNLVRDVARREATERKRDTQGSQNQPLSDLMCGWEFGDDLSPVFAVENCFNKGAPNKNESRVDWPCLAELKEEGDKRAIRYGRYFPLPRMNVVASRILELEGATAYNVDGSIHWDKKAVKLGSRDVLPVTPVTETRGLATHVAFHELPPSMQNLLEEIDKENERN